MMRFTRKTIILRALLLVMMTGFFLFGCASPEEKKARHEKRAQEYLKEGKLKEAVIELRNVVQLDPKDDAAFYQLGETYLKLKKGREAFQAFSRAVSANPANLKAQLKLGQIFLLAKKTDEARKKAKLLLEKDKDDPDALSLLAGVQVQEKDIATAIKTLQKITKAAPNNFKTYLSLGRLFLLKKDLVRSKKAYLKAISLKPESRVAYVELANAYSAEGKWEKAEGELQKLLSISRTRYRDLPLLARFYEHTRKWKKAEKTYREAVDLAPPEEVSPLMNLGAFYARQKDYERALAAFEKAASSKKDNLAIQLAIAQLHYDFRKMDEAQKVVDAILEKDKGQVTANFLKGRLSLAKKDFSGALDRFNLVAREWPRNAGVHYFKALALLGQGKGQLAEKALVKAVELNPRLLDARLLLAERYLRQRDKNLAREQIDAVVKLAPRHVKALMLKGSLEVLEGKRKAAESTFRQVTRVKPDYAPAYVRLGLLYQLAKRGNEARQMLKKALEINPRQIDALAFLVGIHLRKRQFDEALNLCKIQQGKIGNFPRGRATIESLVGKIYLAKGEKQAAELHFKKAVETDPNLLGPYVSLARIYLSGDRWQEAVQEYENILKKNPKFLPAYMALGAMYDQKGMGEKAETFYRKALDMKKDFAPAANNLAWDLATRGGNIDEALGYAQIAKEQMPKNPAIMDTLGWIYYLKGSYLSAISEFQDSILLDSENPVIRYHLGMAFYKNKQFKRAKEALEKALSISGSFKGAEEARNTLETIKKNPRVS
ncbi:MAG: tetratricopeptide repeat protein [Deltaproteobacteria bacterium]|nr:tetratricopeptide repeat protein [Deltaproteobacteria bacterium]